MAESRTEGRRALLMLYDIVIALAITKALERFFAPSGSVQFPHGAQIFLFLAFVSFVSRFFLGSHRVMARDIEMETRPKLIVNASQLILQATGFTAAALCFDELVKIQWVILGILVLECIWLVLLRVFFGPLNQVEKRWLKHDVIMSIVIAVNLAWLHNLYVLFGSSIIAAICDFKKNWDFYFPKVSRRLRIYVAAPYGDGQPGDIIAQNVQKAQEVGKAIALKGHTPFVPHSMLHGWETDARFRVGDFKRIGFDWLEYSDALFYVAPSPGANEERAVAISKGLRVFTSIDQLPDIDRHG